MTHDIFFYNGRTFTAEEQKVGAAKALKLNDNYGIVDPSPDPSPSPIPRIQTGSSLNKPRNKAKPLVFVKRLKRDYPSRYLKGASDIYKSSRIEREKAEKALKLNSLIS